jgi:spore maturation protein CgeB
MSDKKINISSNLRQLLAYPKFTDAVPRVFVFESNYWLDGACLHAAASMGWKIARAPVLVEGAMPRDMVADLLHGIAEFRPDFILSINLSGMDTDGVFTEVFSGLEIPFVTWFVDDPRTIVMGRSCYGSPYSVALTWEPVYEAYLRGVGFAEVHTVPLAVDHTVFNAPPAETCSGPPAFVGNSMTDFAARAWAEVEERPGVGAAVHAAFDAGRVCRENFGAGLDALLGEEAVSTFDAEDARHAEMVCFIEGTRRLRHDLARALEPEGLVVCGDAAWSTVTSSCRDFVNYKQDLSGFYRDTEVNLNTTSIQMATTVNQRVFDCPAAGGFLLTDAQSALHDLFDVEQEVAIYHSMEECRELLRDYRKHPETRRAMTERARKRVLGEHTYVHRLQDIVTLLRARFG